MAGLADRARCARGDSPVPRDEQRCRAQPLRPRPSPGHRSGSGSVRTEDFAARFREGTLEPPPCQEEPPGDVPTEGGRDESLFPTGRSRDARPQLAMEPGRHPRQDTSPSLRRRESLESLGARISRLSQSHVGTAWGRPWAAPSAQPALGRGDSSREDLLAVASPGHSRRAPGISAGRSRAGTGTGSPGSSYPRAGSARTREHPASKALSLKPQEPAALWGRGGIVTLAVGDMEREGAGGRKGIPCSAHRAGTAAAAPGLLGSPVSPGLRGDHKVGLPCKGVAERPVPLRWSLRRSQEGTGEPGSGARTGSQGDRARAGLARLGRAWDASHRCHSDLRRTGQGACVGWERLDKEKRKAETAQGEKLELLERLRELERGCRSLLRQRLRVLHQLHGLLQREKAETLRQLQQALEQDRAARSVRLEHLPEPAVPGRAGGSPTARSPSVAPWGHDPRPSSAAGPGPSPAAFGHALRVLRGLRQQIQRRLGERQRLQGAPGAPGQRQEEREQRPRPEKAPAPGIPREPPAQSEHLHPHPCSSPSLGSIPGLCRRARHSLGLLQHLQHQFQELQLEKAQDSGNSAVLGGDMDTTAREEGQGQPGLGTPPLPQPGC